MTPAEATSRMLSWPLARDSAVVVDVGAFDGTWAAAIASRYAPTHLYLLEPQEEGAHLTRLARAMSATPYHHYQLCPYGLGVRDGIFPMVEANTDGASFVKGKGDPGRRETTFGRMVEAHSWFDELRAEGHEQVDLLSMNIEGGEYALLPHLAKRGDLSYIRFLAVQFHLFADPDGQLARAIREQIAATHDLLWDAYPTWVAWERRQPQGQP